MKKHILTLVACAAVLASGVATQAQDKKMQVKLKNGNSVEYNLTDIDYLTFTQDEVTPPADEKVAYAVAIPTDFTSSRVMKVMAAGKQVAEIDNEYVLATTSVMIVVYPMAENGRADLTKGINVADAGTVVWNASTNKATVTAGSATAALTSIYVVDGELSLTLADGYKSVDATVTPDLLVDVRGTETNSYKIVKVGTQYWMAENLRATKYADGSSITCYKGDEGATWNTDTIGAYHIWADNSELLSVYGCLYSGYTLTNKSGIAPEGWEIPTTTQWTALRTAVNRKPAYLKVNDEVFWGTGNAGTNESGFSAYPCGVYSNSTGDTFDTEAWWWSSTTYYDALPKSYVWDYARVTATGTSMVISTTLTGGHVPQFGHSIRCIRK